METRSPSPIARKKRALQITGLSSSELYRKSHDPGDSFPAAIRLSEHSVGWYEDELIAWRDSRPRITTKTAEAA